MENLSQSYGQDDYTIGHSPMNIGTDEIIKATKNLKSKLCSGEDNLPMKVIKDVVQTNATLFRIFFNSVCEKGIPSRWKTAIVTPLHKAGKKDLVTQYRPISNLDSLSKVYERIVLGRLNELGELNGVFQHGFKANRSTTTAMLELQNYVSTNIDNKKVVGTYSVDLSAAFDLLRPDVFYQQLQSKIPLNLMQTIMDFLSCRKFSVELNGIRSTKRSLKVGCAQGSILGPKLFTLYISKMENLFSDETHLVTFADDSYVSVAGSTTNEVRDLVKTNLIKHNEFLQSIGMVTNVAKTEFILFQKMLMKTWIH